VRSRHTIFISLACKAAGGGARVHLSDRIYAVGEMRLRGLSNFAASTAEWLGGIGWSCGK